MRKTAIWRDKEKISAMQKMIQELNDEIAAWWLWYSCCQSHQQQQHQWQQQHSRRQLWEGHLDHFQGVGWLHGQAPCEVEQEEEVRLEQRKQAKGLGCNVIEEVTLEQQTRTEGLECSVIDYSRWDHLCVSDSDDASVAAEEEDEEKHTEGVVGEVEQMDCYDDYEYDVDDDDEHELGSTESMKYGTVGEEAEDHVFGEVGADMSCEADEEARDGEFSDSGSTNRDRLLRRLATANELIQTEFDEAIARLIQRGAETTNVRALQRTTEQQFVTYQRMMSSMDTDQFSKSGSASLGKLLIEWQKHIRSNLSTW